MPFTSSYARLFLGFSEPISRQIIKHSRPSRSKPLDVLPITILDQEQIDQALSHPQNVSLRETIAGPYVESIRADRKIIQGQESLDEQFVFIEAAQRTLEEKKREVKSDANRAVIENTQASLNQQWKYLQTLKDSLTHQRSQLNEVEKDLNIVEAHDSEWSGYRNNHLDSLSHKVQHLVHIPQEEINNLLDEDLQHLQGVFTDRAIVPKDLPVAKLDKMVGLKKPNFATYFKMKAYLAIRSVLPSSERVPSYMDQLDSFFDETQKEGDQLHTKQSAEIDSLRTHKVEPIRHVAEENCKILDRMQEDRLTQEQIIANIHDIQKNIEARQSIIPAKGPK